MPNVKAYENSNVFKMDVDLEIADKPVKVYRFGKTPPPGLTQEKYLQSCKREALLLAQHEENVKADEFIEIVV